MAKTDRLYKIELLVHQRGSIPFAELLAALEVSPATLKRDLEYLRNQLGAPIEYDRGSNGYRFATGRRSALMILTRCISALALVSPPGPSRS